jgi:hypothetical protein
MIFRSYRHFLGIFLNQKKKTTPGVLGRDSGPRPQCGGVAARSLSGPRLKRRGPKPKRRGLAHAQAGAARSVAAAGGPPALGG